MVTSQDFPVADGLKPTSPGITVQAVKEETVPNVGLPPVTTGTSEKYIRGLAQASSRASASDPLNILFESEKLPQPLRQGESLSKETIQQMLYETAVKRLTAKIANGAFIAEAGNFAAVACWEPESIHEEPRKDVSIEHVRASGSRPIFAEFLEKSDAVKQTHLRPLAENMSPDGRFWHLSMMARDPSVPYVKGAVRAVLVPFVQRFTSPDADGGPVPVWLEAGSERSRAVYAHLGFSEAGSWEAGGVKNWGMIYVGESKPDLRG